MLPPLTLADAELLTARAVAAQPDTDALDIAANLPCCAPIGTTRALVDKLNLRAEPNLTARWLGYMPLETECEVWGHYATAEADWYLLRTPDLTGWAAARYQAARHLIPLGV